MDLFFGNIPHISVSFISKQEYSITKVSCKGVPKNRIEGVQLNNKWSWWKNLNDTFSKNIKYQTVEVTPMPRSVLVSHPGNWDWEILNFLNEHCSFDFYIFIKYVGLMITKLSVL